jgi:hypothetical protein
MTDEQATDETTEPRSGGSAGHSNSGGPFVDDVFAALADWRRREVVTYFRETEGARASVDELAFLLEAYEPDGTGGGSRSHTDLVRALEDDHLPCLADAGVLDFDDRSGMVRYHGQPTVEKWLEHVTAVDGRHS